MMVDERVIFILIIKLLFIIILKYLILNVYFFIMPILISSMLINLYLPSKISIALSSLLYIFKIQYVAFFIHVLIHSNSSHNSILNQLIHAQSFQTLVLTFISSSSFLFKIASLFIYANPYNSPVLEVIHLIL